FWTRRRDRWRSPRHPSPARVPRKPSTRARAGRLASLALLRPDWADELDSPDRTVVVERLLGLHERRRLAAEDPHVRIRRLLAEATGPSARDDRSPGGTAGAG